MATRMHLFMAAHEKWSQSSKLLRPYDETAHHDAFAAAASLPVCPPATYCCRRTLTTAAAAVSFRLAIGLHTM